MLTVPMPVSGPAGYDAPGAHTNFADAPPCGVLVAPPAPPVPAPPPDPLPPPALPPPPPGTPPLPPLPAGPPPAPPPPAAAASPQANNAATADLDATTGVRMPPTTSPASRDPARAPARNRRPWDRRCRCRQTRPVSSTTGRRRTAAPSCRW